MESRFQAHVQDFFAAHTSALGVWARWSLSTRDKGTWCRVFRSGVRPVRDLTDPPVSISDHSVKPALLSAQRGATVRIYQPGSPEPLSYEETIRNVVVAPIVPQVAQVVVAGFTNKTEARSGAGAVEQLARRMLQELQELRRAQETESLLSVPTAPAHLEEARRGLLDLAREVARCLGADGAKIYLVRRAPEGPVLWRAANTEKEVAPRPVLFSPDKGLADYVVWQKTWLLIPRCGPIIELRPGEGVRFEGRKGRGEKVVVYARVGRETDPQAPREKTDDETTILTYPLETDGQITGAVSVWRLRPDEGQPEPPSFDEDLDVASLKNFARHLASACQRVMQLQKAKDQLDETAALARKLAAAERLHEGYEAVASGAGTLADAACAVLLHHEPRKDGSNSGYLYQTAIWRTDGVQPATNSETFLEECRLDPSTWEDTVRNTFGERLKPMVFRKLLLERPTEAQSGAPVLALALFDPPRPEKSPPYFSDELLEHFASAFFQAAALSLRSHVRDLASRLLDRLAGPPAQERGEPLGPEELLNQAAQLLWETTGADQVLVYTGTPHHLQVRQSFPPARSLRGFQIALKSKTAQIVASKRPHRELAVSQASHELDTDVFARLTKTLGWGGVRSWLAYPLVHERRILGLFKLLTCETGGFLGKDVEEITQQVVRYGAWEMYKAARQQALEELLALINQRVGNVHGNQLGEVLVELLRAWADKVLFRPQARVLILARSHGSGTLVKAGAAKDVLDRLEKSLTQLTERFRSGHKFWERNESSDLGHFATYGTGEAFSPFGDPRFNGLVCLGDDEPFDEEDQENLREASRLLSVVLNVERERNDLKVVMGRFRHAALGPIQGMKSAAEDLVEMAECAGADAAAISSLSRSVKREAEFLRLWRENQRFYLFDEIKLKRRPLALRPLVEHCFGRYKDVVSERDVSYNIVWRPSGELRLYLDDAAFDVALSNLLDNAAKYVFHNQRIEVGVEVVKGMVELWVEDVGHGIDASAVDRIFRPQERANPDDPFRTISGQGLGLAMAQKIVEAHDGKLSVKSERYGSGKREEPTPTTPYRVRFTIQLPFSSLR